MQQKCRRDACRQVADLLGLEREDLLRRQDAQCVRSRRNLLRPRLDLTAGRLDTGVRLHHPGISHQVGKPNLAINGCEGQQKLLPGRRVQP